MENGAILHNQPKRAKGQREKTYVKYREAILACTDIDYISLNVSQIARIYGLDGTALANQLRRHYPRILPDREALRRKLGVNDNIHRGVRPWCEAAYSSAVEILSQEPDTVEGVASKHNVSYKGLKEHLTFYHPGVVEQRSEKRASGQWPSGHDAVRVGGKYDAAIALYKDSNLTIAQIAQQLNLGESGLRNHLHKWHPELVLARRGYDQNSQLSQTKRYSPAAREKYAAAIERLSKERIPLKQLATEHGFALESFRKYLKEHRPELIYKSQKK